MTTAPVTDVPLDEVPCALCDDGGAQRLVCTLTDRWHNPGQVPWRIIQCRRCRLLYANPRPRPETLGRWYPAGYYHPVTPAGDWWVRQLACDRAALVARWRPTPGRVLEVGFGAGDLLAALQQRGWDVWGVDPSPEAVRQAGAKLGSTAQLRQADLSRAQLPNDFFDAIVLWHSIEHVPQPRTVLADIARHLRPGGLLFMATPNAGTLQRRWFGPAWSAWRGIGAPPRHLYFFSPRTLRQLTALVGLRVLAVDQRVDALANWIAFKGSLLAWLGAVDDDTAPPTADAKPPTMSRRPALLRDGFRSLCWMASTALAWCGSGDTMVLIGRKE